MFSFFKKKKTKNKIQELIEQDGIEHATQRFADVISDMLKSKTIAHQFILEEIDAASQGSNKAIKFALDSGIFPSEYKNAMEKHCPEIVGKDGPQHFLLNISSQLNSDKDLMVEFRLKITDKIMKRFHVGKYSINESTGINKYNQLKQLMLNEQVSEALELNAYGVNQTSLLIAHDVNTAVSLVNFLSTLTDISGVELIEAISENQHDKQITSIIMDKESLEEYERAGSNDAWMDTLIQWANENNLKELQNFDSPAYKQTGFPRNKSQFLSMEYLHLPNANISYLPTELGKLKNLCAICLDGNSIENYPEEMCYYKNLIRLDLDDNKVSNFPKEFGNLTSLQVLSLDNNCIKDFPIEMTKLNKLRKFDLSNQEIHLSSKFSPLSPEGFKVYNHFFMNDVIKEESVQNWLDKNEATKENIETDKESSWVDVIIAWADNNSIPDLEWVEDSSHEKAGFWTGLPRDKNGLLSLTQLNLSDMNLTELPEEISNLTKLELINVSYNNLTKLPLKIGYLSNLKSLDIRCEKLFCVPDSIIELVNLRYLGFYDITSLDNSKLTHEFYLNWIYNLLKGGCDMSMGDVSDMGHNSTPVIQYFRIDQNTWKRAPTLRELDGGLIVETRFVESEDKFIRKVISR